MSKKSSRSKADASEKSAAGSPKSGTGSSGAMSSADAGGLSRMRHTLFSIRLLTLAVTFMTGFTGLIYENAWQRYLANFLGSQAQATSVILAVFLGGLCVGYRIFGAVTNGRSPRSLLTITGVTEVVIGLWALFFHQLYMLVWHVSGVVDPKSYISSLWEIGVSVALMGVPTVLMGGTLPLLTQALSADLADAAPFHARVYAVNTGGAFVGCLIAGFFLLPQFGLRGTMELAGPINIIAGLLLCLFARYLSTVPVNLAVDSGDSGRAVPEQVGHLPERAAVAAAFLAGLYSIALQTVFVRLVALSMGSSEYAFSLVVAVFIAMLALGSWKIAGARSLRIPIWLNQLVVLLGGLAVYCSVSYWPYSTHVVRILFATNGPSFWVYHLSVFIVLALVLAIPVGAMGSTMPLLFGEVRRSLEDVGKVVGRLYAWNTIGCVVGALFGGYWLLLFVDLDSIYLISLFAMGLGLLLTCPWGSMSTRYRPVALGTVFLLFITPLFLPPWIKPWLGNGYFRSFEAMESSFKGPQALWDATRGGVRHLDYRDAPNSTVAISEYDADEEARRLNDGATIVRNIKVNGKSDGETSGGDMRTMRLTAHLPGLLSVIPIKKVAVVGFGLGVTVGSMTLYPEVEEVHVMEISHAVRQFAHYFDFANYGVTTNPKVHWSIGDAYRVLGASDQKYSLIVSEPSNPWVTGVERLFAKEFYDIVKSKLEPGGIYSQWIHDYSLSTDTLALVIRTFGNSFKHVRIFRTNRDIIMLGSDEFLGERSIVRATERYDSNQKIQRALEQVRVANLPQLLGLETWLTHEQFEPGPIQTLEFPRLSHMAGHDFFMNNDAELGDYLNTPERRLWGHAYAQQSLIAFWLRGSPQPDESLRQFAITACDIKMPWFWPNWKQDQKSCKDALIGLALRGIVKPENGINDHEISLLRMLVRDSDSVEVLGNAPPVLSSNVDGSAPVPDEGSLASWNQLAPAIKVLEIRGMAELYGSYSSIFTHTAPEKLDIASRNCQASSDEEALRCRSQLVEVYAVTGSPAEAKKLLTQLKADNASRQVVSSVRIAALEGLVKMSEQARERYGVAGPRTE